MPVFDYEAITAAGKTVKGSLEARLGIPGRKEEIVGDRLPGLLQAIPQDEHHEEDEQKPEKHPTKKSTIKLIVLLSNSPTNDPCPEQKIKEADKKSCPC